MAIQDTGTILTISVMGVPYYSARGLTQSLEPIAGTMERDVNGTLVDLTPVGFQKYKTSITCTDTAGPAIDGIFPGQVVTIECVAELAYPTGGSPSRSVVSGSAHTDPGGFTRYRPSLTMMITACSVSKDEFAATTAWQIDAEEI